MIVTRGLGAGGQLVTFGLGRRLLAAVVLAAKRTYVSARTSAARAAVRLAFEVVVASTTPRHTSTRSDIGRCAPYSYRWVAVAHTTPVRHASYTYPRRYNGATQSIRISSKARRK